MVNERFRSIFIQVIRKGARAPCDGTLACTHLRGQMNKKEEKEKRRRKKKRS